MTDAQGADQVACPHCGEQQSAVREKDQAQITCSGCGKQFHLDQVAKTIAPTLSDAPTIQQSDAIEPDSNDGPETAPTLIAEDDKASPFDATRLMTSSEQATNKFGIEPAHSERRFRVHGEIARGGMGAILKSHDEYLQREVAMKVILGSGVNQTQLRRFVEEAQITGQLEHPSIVPVHELGVDQDGKFYYTMKMVHGHTLKDILHDLVKGNAETIEQYPLARLLDVFNRICDAISFAHSKGIIHRDLKPENIMIGDFGEVQVMDWGLAKNIGENALEDDDTKITTAELPQHVGDADASDKTLEGHIVGTPQYMAPEQARGDISSLCRQTDIYALGAILYQMLTLRPPVSGKSVQDLLSKVMSGEITPPLEYNSSSVSRSNKNPGKEQETKRLQRERKIVLKHCPNNIIPISLSAVCMRAMETEIEDRYATAALLQRDIQSYQQGFATEAEGANAFRQISLLIKRHKAACSMIAGSLLVLMIIVIVFVHNLQIKEQVAVEEKGKAVAARNTAETERVKAESALASAEYSIYRMAIKDASRLIEEALLSDAATALEKVNPSLRHWEYYHLQERIATRSLRNVMTLEGHTKGINVMKMSPNKKVLASGSSDGQIKLWDMNDGGLIKTIQYKKPFIISDLKFSPDGKMIAVSDREEGVKIWDVASGKLIKALDGVQEPAMSVAFTPDGKKLVGCGIAWSVHVWDTSNWKQLNLFTYSEWVSRMELLPDGKRFALVHGNASIGIYELETNKRLAHMPRAIDYLRDHCMAFTKDGSKLIAAGEDKKIKIWDTETGKLLKELSGHASIVESVALSDDEQYIASGSHDHTIRLWDMQTGNVAHIDQGHSDTVTEVLFANDDRYLWSTALDKSIKKWQMPKVESRITLKGKKGLMEHVQFTKNGKQMLTTSDKDEIQIWDVQTGKLLGNVAAWPSKIWKIEYGSGDQEIAVFSEDTDITIINAKTGEPRMVLKDHTHWPAALEYAPNGKYLASACSKPSLKIWNCEKGDLIHDISIENEVTGLCFSPDGKTLAVNEKNKLHTYDVTTGERKLTFNSDPGLLGIIIFTNDGKHILTGGWNHLIKTWDVKTGDCIRTMKGHYSFVDLLEITNDGKRLVSGSYDNSVIVWDMETGEQLLTHKVDIDLMGSKISSDGKSIFVVLDDSSIEMLRSKTPVKD